MGVLAWSARYRSILGIYVGAALLAFTVTIKQNAVTLAPLWLFAAGYTLANRSGVPWFKALFSVHMALCGLLALAVFLLNYPTLLDLAALDRLQLIAEKIYLPGAEDGGKHHLWNFWITRYWPGQAHPLVLILLTVGLALLPFLSRDRLTAWFIVAATVLYYAIAGSSEHLRLRTIIPLVPGLCIGVAGWFLLFGGYLSPGLSRRTATALTLLAVVSLLSNSVRQTLLIALPDTTELAVAWIDKNVKRLSKVAQETYTTRLTAVYPGQVSARYAERRGQNAFQANFFGSLATQGPEFYRNERFDYLLAHEKNRTLAEQALKTGEEATRQDKFARATGRTGRYGGVPLSEVVKNYKAIESEFEVAARFVPNAPDNQDFAESSYPWWRWESFIHPGAWDLWTNFGQYRMGKTVTIYRVK